MPIGLIGGLVSGGGSLLSGILGSNASTSAASTAAAAQEAAAKVQLQEFQQIQQQLLPYLYTGQTGNQVLSSNYFGINGPTGGFNPQAPFLQPISSVVGPAPSPTDPTLAGKFQASPGYQYALGQGQQASTNAASRSSGALSGPLLQALQGNAVGLANQDWNNFYGQLVQSYGTGYQDVSNQRNTIINYLSGLAGAGQNAAANLGGFGQTAATNIGQNLVGAGNATAAGTLGAANAGINALSSPGFSSGANNALNYLFGNNGGAGATPQTIGGVMYPGGAVPY